MVTSGTYKPEVKNKQVLTIAQGRWRLLTVIIQQWLWVRLDEARVSFSLGSILNTCTISTVSTECVCAHSHLRQMIQCFSIWNVTLSLKKKNCAFMSVRYFLNYYASTVYNQKMLDSSLFRIKLQQNKLIVKVNS